MRKYIVITVLFLFLITPVLAATTDFTANGNITVSSVTFGSTTADLLIIDTSTTESWTFDSGTFTATNPGTFKVGSSDSSVKSIVSSVGGSVVACAVNTTPGTSYVTLTTATAVHTIEPTSNTSCETAYCTSLANTTSYNSFPTCGSASCASGYTVSGSGSSATCVSTGGGSPAGGGGYSYSPPATQQTSLTSVDGTQITSTVSSSSGTASVTASINTVASPTNTQTISLDTSAVAEVNNIDVGLSGLVMQELVASHGASTNLTVNITSQSASSDQRSNSALSSSTFLVGSDIFTIDISAGDTSITNFENPLTLSFDVSDIQSQENLTIAWFDTSENKWVDLVGTLSDGILSVTINHLTDFAVIRKGLTDTETETISAREEQVNNILNESSLVQNSSSDLLPLLSHNNTAEDKVKEISYMEKYTNKLTEGMSDLTSENSSAINNFIVYGTKTTKILGAGERAGVVSSFKSALGKLPITEEDWNDVIKIANGRWPTQQSIEAEERATVNFKIVYLREPDRTNPNDDAAIVVMAYGLRPANRNLDSEKTAIKIFKDIYGYNPKKASAWDVVRAIAYSGATR